MTTLVVAVHHRQLHCLHRLHTQTNSAFYPSWISVQTTTHTGQLSPLSLPGLCTTLHDDVRCHSSPSSASLPPSTTHTDKLSLLSLAGLCTNNYTHRSTQPSIPPGSLYKTLHDDVRCHGSPSSASLLPLTTHTQTNSAFYPSRVSVQATTHRHTPTQPSIPPGVYTQTECVNSTIIYYISNNFTNRPPPNNEQFNKDIIYDVKYASRPVLN